MMYPRRFGTVHMCEVHICVMLVMNISVDFVPSSNFLKIERMRITFVIFEYMSFNPITPLHSSNDLWKGSPIGNWILNFMHGGSSFLILQTIQDLSLLPNDVESLMGSCATPGRLRALFY